MVCGHCRILVTAPPSDEREKLSAQAAGGSMFAKMMDERRGGNDYAAAGN